MTLTPNGRETADSGKRLAVTTTSFSCVWANDGNAAAKAKGSAAKRAQVEKIFMKTNDTKEKPSPSSPTVHERYGSTQACNHRVGRYPGWWNNLHRLPKRVFKTLSGCDGSGIG